MKLAEGQVVGVFRRCKQCGKWKALAHFLLHGGRTGNFVEASVKVCETCRRASR